jgi:hypothetical protein
MPNKKECPWGPWSIFQSPTSNRQSAASKILAGVFLLWNFTMCFSSRMGNSYTKSLKMGTDDLKGLNYHIILPRSWFGTFSKCTCQTIVKSWKKTQSLYSWHQFWFERVWSMYKNYSKTITQHIISRTFVSLSQPWAVLSDSTIKRHTFFFTPS